MVSFESDLLSGPSTLSKRTAYWGMACIGTLLAGALFFDAYTDWIYQEASLWSTLLENSIPILLALALPYASWHLLRERTSSTRLPEAAKWTVVGALGMILLSGLVMGIHVLQRRVEPSIVVLQMATIGAFAGLWVGRSIARVKEAEQQAQEDRDRLANLLEGLPAPVVHGRFEGDKLHLLTANAAFEEVFGQDVEEVVGRDVYDLVVPEQKREEAAEIDRQAIEDGLAEKEVRRPTTEGPRDFWVRVAQALDDGASETYAIYTDITERKRRKEKLERQNDLFEMAQEIANVGSWEYNLQAEELSVTDQTYRVHGLAPDENLTPERSHGFFHPEDRPMAAEAFRRAIEEGEPYDLEARLITEEGDERWIRTRGQPQREGGEIVRVRGAIQDITDRKKREKELQATTARLSALYEHSPDMINIHDPEGTIIDPNPRFLEKTGYDRDAVEDMKVWEIDQHMDPDEAAALWEDMETGDRVELKGAYRRQDGSVFPVEIHVRKLDLEGADRFMVISRDITKRKEAENELEETIRFYEQVLEQAPIDLAVFTPDAKFEYVNPRSVTDPDRREWLLGRTNEEYCRKRGLDAEIGRRRDAAIREAAEAKRRTEQEETLDTGEGPRHYLRVHGPVTDMDGNVTQVAAFGLDITERKRHAWTLEERQEKVEALYKATNRLLRATDESTVATSIVDVVGEVFGYIVGVRFLEDGQLIPVQLSPEVSDHMPDRPPLDPQGQSVLAEAFRSGETAVFDDVHTADDPLDYGEVKATVIVPLGQHGALSVSDLGVGTIGDFDRQLIEILSTYAELVLDRIHREETLRAAKREAEEAAQLKTAMLANMSHEIRTPLTSITGFSEMLQENLEGELKVFATKIHEGSQRLQRTLESVLHLSKLEAGVHELDRQELSLEEVAEAVVEEIGHRAEEKSLTLTTDSPSTPTFGHWNEDAVHRICRNLLENAIKFTPTGGRVDLRIGNEDGEAILEVEDTGIGMDPDEIEELFEAFKQESEGLDREFEGSGLGLSIVRRLTEELGGTVVVETEKGEGTCFTVRLPRT